MDLTIDARVAERTARALVPPGPKVSPAQARELVAGLCTASAEAAGHVARITEIDLPASRPEVSVVGRPAWVRANLIMVQEMFSGANRREPDAPPARASWLDKAGSTQLGALMAFLSVNVLGQFVPYGPQPRLLLVAPNIRAVADRLAVDEADFSLWVCLHEETHRLQFTHAPWLAEHLQERLDTFLAAVDTGGISWSPAAFSDLRKVVDDPAQARALDDLIATMSLLEGHAELVMDAGGTAVIPSLRTIRRRFDARRRAGGISGLVRKVLGVDQKLRQYTEGAVFCRSVVEKVGMSGLNRVWTSPNTLPSAAEIADPDIWLRRLGRSRDREL